MKKYWYILLIIVLVIVGGVIYFVISDLNKEKDLLNEMDSIYELMENNNQEELTKKLSEVISTGDYAIVEKAAKDYIKDLYEVTTNIASIISDDKIMTLTTYENFENDGPDFTESKKYIEETKENLENYKNLYAELYTEEKELSYLSKQLDEYYIDFYLNYLIGNQDNQEDIANIETIINILSASENVIDFLIDNKDAWKLNNNMISFNSEELSNQYNDLILKIGE